MQSFLFLRGLAIGFALAAPVGPVGVLCIRRAVADGRYAAFIAGLGAAVADTFYGAVAGLGLTVVSSFLMAHQLPLRIVGGLFLLALGLRGLSSRPCVNGTDGRGPGLVKDFVSTFLITLTNPATILASMGVFAAVGTLGHHDMSGSGVLISGVFVGSSLWWLVLSAAAGAVRSRCPQRLLGLLYHGSAVILVVSGLAIMGSVVVVPLLN
jgi:threonine/homoserine/homoserine lactone efflux protein